MRSIVCNSIRKRKEILINNQMKKKTQYRIKVITMKNDRREYQPQVKKHFLLFPYWRYIDNNGEEDTQPINANTRIEADLWIKKHKEGNTKIKHVGFFNVN
jgi:hypothetical protein